MLTDPVNELINRLLASQTTTLTETKDGMILRRVIPEAAIADGKALMRSFFPASKTYRFRLTATLSIGTNGSGATLGFASFSPSVTSYNEWSALSALFDEVKGVKQRLTAITTFGGTSTAIIVPFAIAPDYSNINTTPSSAASVNRLAESEIWAGGLVTTAKGTLVKETRSLSGLDWATVGTPAVQSPPSGMLGQWSFASQIIAGTPSINYFYAFMDCLAMFRMRA